MSPMLPLSGPAECVWGCVHASAAALGGSLCAALGVGLLSVRAPPHYKSPAALELMRTLKRALDPHGIMNPGKML